MSQLDERGYKPMRTIYAPFRTSQAQGTAKKHSPQSSE